MKLGGQIIPNAVTANLATEEWLASFEKYAQEEMSGKFSSESFLKWLESCPPEVQSNPANRFEPTRREMIQELKEKLCFDAQLSRNPSSPLDSQVQAIAGLIAEKIGITRFTGDAYVAAELPLRRAVAKIEPIEDKLLEQFDAHLFAMLRFQERRREFPPGFEDRVRLAAQMNDLPFFVQLGKSLSKPAPFNQNSDLGDFKLRTVNVFLLKNWSQLEGCADKIGLCDLTWPALEDFFVHKFGYQGSVRDLARDARPGLQKSKAPKVKKVQEWKRAIWQVGDDGKRGRELSRVES